MVSWPTIALVLAAAATSEGCPSPFAEFNGKCYYVSENKMEHVDAKAECTEMGGILAKVSDLGTAEHVCHHHGTTWIGLNGSSDGWTWADGSEFVKEEDFGGATFPPDFPSTKQCVYVDCTLDGELHFFAVPCSGPWSGKYACELSSKCPMPYEEFKGKCYYLSKEKMDHVVAETECSEMGGTLADVSDEDVADHLCINEGYTWVFIPDSMWTWSKYPPPNVCYYHTCSRFEGEADLYYVLCEGADPGRYACELQDAG